MQSGELLRVEGLKTYFYTRHGVAKAVDGVDFALRKGERLGLVGESGSGKSVTALSIMRLIRDPPGRIVSGRIMFEGCDLLTLDEHSMRQLRGSRIAMIFQDPVNHLDPIMKVGEWIAQTLVLHKQMSRKEAMSQAARILSILKVPSPDDVLHAYPFQLSGGMCQRVLIATAIATEPALIIADEATSALDVTVQASILSTLNDLAETFDTAVLLTTHNMRVVQKACSRVIVMYAGTIAESCSTQRLFANPLHPYTAGLLRSVPALERIGEPLVPMDGEPPLPTDDVPGCVFYARCPVRQPICGAQRPPLRKLNPGTSVPACFRRRSIDSALLKVDNLVKHYPASRQTWLAREPRTVKAVDGVSLHIAPGEVVAVVGESGCGKSTLARLVLRLIEPTSGTIQLDGKDITHLEGRALRNLRLSVQIVFQDPMGSLNPRMTVGAAIAYPLKVNGLLGRGGRRATQDKVAAMLTRVGLSAAHARRLPHELSGGQRQRIGIARAIIVNPKLVVLDEPVAALDVSAQARVLNLFKELRDDLGMAYLFITHDLSVAEYMADRIVVMYAGQIVETGERARLFKEPRHPYTEALLSAAVLGGWHDVVEEQILEGDPPSPIDPPSGCRFNPRCPHAAPLCKTEAPVLTDVGDGHLSACHLTSGKVERVRADRPSQARQS